MHQVTDNLSNRSNCDSFTAKRKILEEWSNTSGGDNVSGNVSIDMLSNRPHSDNVSGARQVLEMLSSMPNGENFSWNVSNQWQVK
jgi:hypothetical protein